MLRATQLATKCVFFGLAALALVTAQIAVADYIQPGLVKIKTESYTPGKTDFPRGTYEYSIDWQGIPVGKASIITRDSEIPSGITSNQPLVSVMAKATTSSVISIFYSLVHVSESIFHADSLKPISFYTVQTENSKTKSREVSFDSSGHIKAVIWKKGSPAPEEQFDFISENATFDPISAAFLARTLPVELGKEFSFDVFNGKHRFLITLSVEAIEKISVGGVIREAYRVTPNVKKLTDSEGEKRLRKATLWISTDANREVLRLKSEVAVGSVNAELKRFVPAPAGLPAGSARASLRFGEPPQDLTR